MSTCSTATSAHRVSRRRRRRPPASSDSDGRRHLVLERRLLNLERDWDAYKTVRGSGAPRHRRSRSASSAATTPSSAVTVAAAPEGLLLLPLLRRSPRRVVWSLQQPSSSAGSDADGAAKIVRQQGNEEDASSVCSVLCSRCQSWCPCQRAVLCQRGYSASSSCSCTGSSTTAPSFPSPVGGIINGGRARKMGEGKWVAGRVLWISAIALLVVVGFVAMVILEVGVDEGGEEYLVPT